MSRVSRVLSAIAILCALVTPRGASAQVAYSSFSAVPPAFGPSYQTVFLIGGGNWLASSFVYTDPTALLGSIDVAAQDIFIQGFTNPLDVTFLTGSTMQGATALESWVIPVGNPPASGIYPLASVLDPTLVTGQTYWVELSTAGYAWNWYYGASNLNNTNISQSSDGGAHWSDNSANPEFQAPAFDVITQAQGTTLSVVTPEPATMSLMALGLVSMVGAGIRRRKRDR